MDSGQKTAPYEAEVYSVIANDITIKDWYYRDTSPEPYGAAMVLRSNCGAALTGAVLDRLTHWCHIVECNEESYRLRAAKRRQSGRKWAN